MLNDLQDALLTKIQEQLKDNQNVEKVQTLIYDLIKPYKYILLLVTSIVLMTFILNIINIVLQIRNGYMNNTSDCLV